jgi:hypothetical protein
MRSRSSWSKELGAHGSSQAGPKIAAILSVVESCRRLKLPVSDYLAAVSFRTRRSPDPTPPLALIPSAWASASVVLQQSRPVRPR